MTNQNKKLTRLEAENWGRLDAEIRNNLLSQQLKHKEIQLKQYEIRDIVSTGEQYISQKQNEINSLKKELSEIQRLYSNTNTALAKKYKFDINKVAIDPSTGLIKLAV